MISQSKPVLYSESMWQRLGDHSPYSDLDITAPKMTRWHPLNQSLYVGYKVMLAGLLMISKGDRIAMNASVETRYPYLDDDVISFCAGIAPEYKLHGMTEKWILRQVAARILPKQIANRPKTMFRSSLAQTFLGSHRPPWVDQLLSPDSLRATGYFDVGAVLKQRSLQTILPRLTPARFIFDVALTCVVSTQLWHHIYCGGGLCNLPEWEPPQSRWMIVSNGSTEPEPSHSQT
jgi:asparagine synthase (glutamine-hydrolysing)